MRAHPPAAAVSGRLRGSAREGRRAATARVGDAAGGADGGNAIWTGDTIQAGLFGFALLVLLLWATVLALASPRGDQARGAAEPERPRAAPDISLGAALALGIGALCSGWRSATS